jgi:ferredoxin
LKVPVIDLEDCTECDACVEICPEVFIKNDLGLIVVSDLSAYPEEEVDEVIKNCPCDCISWEGV